MTWSSDVISQGTESGARMKGFVDIVQAYSVGAASRFLYGEEELGCQNVE